MEDFKKIISDFALSMKKIDSTKPVYVSQRKNKNVYKPGIGPHTETATINLVVNELKQDKFYTKIEREIKYPNSRKSCDLKFNINNKILFSEVKMMRIMGDNNKANDNIFMHIFSPYEKQNSALTDGLKLLKSGFDGEKSIIIYGYDYDDFPIEKTISLFEKTTKDFFNISERYSASFEKLVHPVHTRGSVYGWTIKNK
tara:strand:+ start:50 stop:646 length:597 start_codon:yes stop_codon:yes gene_type:complete